MDESISLPNVDPSAIITLAGAHRVLFELAAEVLTLRADLAAWGNIEPLSPDPERVQLRALGKENVNLRVQLDEIRLAISNLPCLTSANGCFEAKELFATIEKK